MTGSSQLGSQNLNELEWVMLFIGSVIFFWLLDEFIEWRKKK